MNKQREAKLNSYDAIIEGVEQEPAVPPTMAAFEAVYNLFTAKVDDIHDKAEELDKNTSGDSLTKEEAKEEASQAFADNATVVKGYAKSTGKNDLYALVDYSYRELVRAKDEDFPGFCNHILDGINDNLAALAAYNITAATVTSLTALLDAFTTASPKPKNNKANRKAIDIALDKLFDDADAMLEDQLDNLIVGFKTSHPDFYNRYQSNRNVDKNPTSSTRIRGLVKDGDGNVIVGALVQIVGTEIKTNTNSKGRYILKQPTPGTYSITITAAGFTTQTINGIIVKLGQSTTVNVVVS